jgi:hypothetical protein
VPVGLQAGNSRGGAGTGQQSSCSCCQYPYHVVRDMDEAAS